MTTEEYFEEWWTPKELPKNGFNKTAMLDFAEWYAQQKALRQPPVVGRSEQLVCQCEDPIFVKDEIDETIVCMKCENIKAN